MSDDKKLKFKLVLALTVARLPFALAFSIIMFLAGKPEEVHKLITFSIPFAETLIAILILGELTDFFDGMLARKLGVQSEAGATLDPYCDSVSRLLIYWSLAYAGLALPVVPLVMAIRDITMSYIRIVFSKTGLSVSAKFGGKLKAVIQGYGCVVLFLQPIYWHWGLGKWTIQAGSWIIILTTVISTYEYLKVAVKQVKKI